MTDDELRDEIPEGTGGSEQITERNYSVCGAKKRQGGDPCTRPAGWGTPPQSSRYPMTVLRGGTSHDGR